MVVLQPRYSKQGPRKLACAVHITPVPEQQIRYRALPALNCGAIRLYARMASCAGEKPEHYNTLLRHDQGELWIRAVPRSRNARSLQNAAQGRKSLDWKCRDRVPEDFVAGV